VPDLCNTGERCAGSWRRSERRRTPRFHRTAGFAIRAVTRKSVRRPRGDLPMIRILVYAGIVALGCASCFSTTPQADVTQGERDFAATAESLRLELEPKTTSLELVDLDRSHEFRFFLQNVSAHPVEICIGSGVSTRIRSGTRGWRTIRRYGRPTDVRCPSKLRLDPGAKHLLTESMVLLSGDFQDGSAELQSLLYVELPQSCCSCRYGCAFGNISGVHKVLLARREQQ
jgi:hypothetical protein